MERYYPKPRAARAAAAASAPATLEAAPAGAPPAPADARALRRARRAVAAAPAAAAAAEPAAREVGADAPAIAARISTAGGRVTAWQLKRYQATGATAWEDLAPLRSGRVPEGPLSVRLSDAPDVAWDPAEISAAGRVLTSVQRLAGGRVLTKRLTLPAEGYVASLDLALDGPAPESLDVLWTPGVGLSPDEEAFLHRAATYQNVPTAALLTRKDLLSQKEDKAPKAKGGADPFWVAVRNKYFVAALLPPAPAACEGVAAVEGEASTPGTPHALAAAVRFRLAPGASRVRIPLRVYAGPLELDHLAAAGARLEKAANFGFFGWLAVPMVKVLKFLAAYVRNYGVAIILLTLMVRGVLWFPSQWGLNQMKRMQALQPQILFIKEQFKDDPKRQQDEQMRLFREQKINPAGGCLPVLLQIPVFFALYSALGNSIELRGAPFALWVRDLSVMDPFYVLPVLVGGSMFLTQLMTPVTGDPAQAKMMRWMTLAFCFMFLKMPSGLMLYWLASNLVQILQQLRTNRSLAVPAGTKPA